MAGGRFEFSKSFVAVSTWPPPVEAPVADVPPARSGSESCPTGLTWSQLHQAARVVASASTDAADCAQLLAALGIHPADGLPSPGADPGSRGEVAGPGQGDAAPGVRRRRHIGRRARD